MKTLAILLVTIAAASALQLSAPIGAGVGNQAQAAGASAAGARNVQATGRSAGVAAQIPAFVDYGPKVYGMGAKNALALPPNPFLIQRAVTIANTVPNVLVRLDLNGEVTLTNQFGQEVDVVDAFGREIELEY